MPLHTPRLILMPFAAEHLGALTALFREPFVRRYLLDDTLVDSAWVAEEIAQSEARFSAGSLGLWAASLRESPGAIIGFAGLRPFDEPPGLQLTYGLAPAWTGRGLATEMAQAVLDRAFGIPGFEEVFAATDAPNEASVRVLRRLGFRPLGVFPGALGPLLRFATWPGQAIVERLAPGARIDRVWPLTGGVSKQVTAIAYTREDGASERVVARRHRSNDWRPGDPSELAREHALLAALAGRGVPVPTPRAFIAPDTLVLDFVEGETTLPPPGVVAATLAAVHTTPTGGLPPLPEREDPLPALRSWAPELAARLPTRLPAGPRCLLHGDFWPGNLLWRGVTPAAVLDWEDAALGDPLSDLACARAELLCATDRAYAEEFTKVYLGITGFDPVGLPVWDLYVSTAALRSMDQWGLAPEALAKRRAATTTFRDGAARALR